MKYENRFRWALLLGTAIIFLITSCGSPAVITPTPTPTGIPVIVLSPTPPASPCQGLSGALEMQVLVGPAEVVGLEPLAVGAIPFSVVSEGGAYIVTGGGPISYQDVYTAEWGTYSVSMNLENTINGVCSGPEGSAVLDISLESSGNQMVEVRSEGFNGDYPWEGTHVRELSFPLESGASAAGEGWVINLILNP